MAYNLIVAGVGGQGSILASRIIADAAIRQGMEAGQNIKVRVGETFGAAMRGGSVASHVRIGTDVGGPLVPKNSAQAVLASEPLEGLRIGVPYLAPGATAILNTLEIMPVEVKVGSATYPSLDTIKTALERLGGRVILIDATELALKAGNAKSLSTVMLGALARATKLPFTVEQMRNALRGRVPGKTVDVNLKAFDLGYEFVAKNFA